MIVITIMIRAIISQIIHALHAVLIRLEAHSL